jgi:hypothetical protein
MVHCGCGRRSKVGEKGGRMSKVIGGSWIAALAVVIGVGLSAPAQAGRFDDLLMWVAEKFMSTVKVSPEARAFQADLQRYRVEVKSMPPQKAVEGWLALYDRARKLGGAAHMLADAETDGPLGVGALFGALLAPEAWPALLEAAKARAEKAPADSAALGLHFAMELLVADPAAAKATLNEIEALAKRPGAEDWRLRIVADARAQMAELYGTREEIAASFVALLLPAAEERQGDGGGAGKDARANAGARAEIQRGLLGERAGGADSLQRPRQAQAHEDQRVSRQRRVAAACSTGRPRAGGDPVCFLWTRPLPTPPVERYSSPKSGRPRTTPCSHEAVVAFHATRFNISVGLCCAIGGPKGVRWHTPDKKT